MSDDKTTGVDAARGERVGTLVTPETAPEAITQAEAWRVNPNTPSTIITPHGRISIRWTVASAGSASDYSLAEQTAAQIVEAMNHRRLTSHSAGEGLREALAFYADPDGDGYRVDVTNYGLSTEEGEIVRDGGKRAREALLATPPSDAGSTTRSGGEGDRHCIPFGSPPEPVSNPSDEWCEAYAAWYEGRAAHNG